MTREMLNALLDDARNFDRATRHAMMAECRTRSQHDAVLLSEYVLPATRSATKDEYMAWLAGHLSAGGHIMFSDDGPFPASQFKMVLRRFTPVPLFGSSALKFIVPSGTSIGAGQCGHCEFYYMKDFTVGNGYVTIYSDLHF